MSGFTEFKINGQGEILCVICFQYNPKTELFVHRDTTWNVCKPCGEREVIHWKDEG